MRRALIVVASVVAACKGGRAARSGPPPDDAAIAVQGPPTRVLDPVAVVPTPRPPTPRLLRERLLEPGAAPRERLRYRLAPAARTLVATSRITSHAYEGTWSEPVALAPVREGFAAEPAAGGVVHVRGLVAELDRDGQPGPAIAAADAYLARWRALLERRRADVTVDDRGHTDGVALAGDAGAGVGDAKDELVQRWVGLVVPLPAEPVGVGARWEVVTMLRAGGAAVTQTARYRLVAVEHERWTIAVELTRLGRPQAIDVPGLPAGASAELVGMVRTVTGTVTVTPGNPLPLAGELAAEVRTQARFTLAGEPPRDQYSEDTATITLAADGAPPSAPPAPAPPPAP